MKEVVKKYNLIKFWHQWTDQYNFIFLVLRIFSLQMLFSRTASPMQCLPENSNIGQFSAKMIKIMFRLPHHCIALTSRAWVVWTISLPQHSPLHPLIIGIISRQPARSHLHYSTPVIITRSHPRYYPPACPRLLFIPAILLLSAIALLLSCTDPFSIIYYWKYNFILV